MKLPKHWRYRCWTYWADFGHFCGYVTLPYKVIRAKLWDWCHYRHGAGSHLNLNRRSWWAVCRSEFNRYKYGEY